MSCRNVGKKISHMTNHEHNFARAHTRTHTDEMSHFLVNNPTFLPPDLDKTKRRTELSSPKEKKKRWVSPPLCHSSLSKVFQLHARERGGGGGGGGGAGGGGGENTGRKGSFLFRHRGDDDDSNSVFRGRRGGGGGRTRRQRRRRRRSWKGRGRKSRGWGRGRSYSVTAGPCSSPAWPETSPCAAASPPRTSAQRPAA